MKIIETRYSEVKIEDENHNTSLVFRQSDMKWKCLRCQRYRCEHAKWVTEKNLTLPEMPPTKEEINDILTY